MRPKSEPIAPPIVGHVSPDATPHDVDTSAAIDWRGLDTPTVLRRAEETQRALTSTAKEVRTALVPFGGRTVDLDTIDEMSVAVVARLRERGLL